MKTALDSIVVLYVEDDPLTLQSVSNRLRRNGMTVIGAESGERALTLIEDRPRLAAALLDIHLPGIDGLETSTRLRQVYPALPIIVCSAHLDAPLRKRLLAMGVPPNCQLLKPCPFQELLAAVAAATLRHRSNAPPVDKFGPLEGR